jgi:hypothetical protein
MSEGTEQRHERLHESGQGMEPTRGDNEQTKRAPTPVSEPARSAKPPPSSLGFSLDAPPLSDVLEEADRLRRHELQRDLRAVAYGALFALAGLAALAWVLA